MTKPRKKAAPTSQGVLDRALDTLDFGLKELQAELESIAKGKAKSNGHDKGSRIAFLTQRVGAIADSVRKVEAARAKRADALTPEAVIEWFRGLDEREKVGFLRELEQVSAARSGLA